MVARTAPTETDCPDCDKPHLDAGPDAASQLAMLGLTSAQIDALSKDGTRAVASSATRTAPLSPRQLHRLSRILSPSQIAGIQSEILDRFVASVGASDCPEPVAEELYREAFARIEADPEHATEIIEDARKAAAQRSEKEAIARRREQDRIRQARHRNRNRPQQ